LKTVIIIGIDPGTTTGLAILDTRGDILSLRSKRDIKRNEVIREITSFGRPIIVASDVFPAPKSVEKISSFLGSKLFCPEKSLSLEEKSELAENFSDRIKNYHERDALSAGLKAWRNYKNLFDKVENTLKILGLQELFEDVVLKLLKEESDNIDNALERVLEKRRRVDVELKVPSRLSLQDYQKLVEELKKRLESRDEEIIRLAEQSDNLNKSLRETREDLESIRSSVADAKNIQTIREELQKMRKGIELWKKIRKVEMKGFEPVLEIEKISGIYLEELDGLFGLKDRIVFCEENKNLNLLNGFLIKALILEKAPTEKEIERLEFPVLMVGNEIIKNFDGIKAVKKNLIEEEIKKVRKAGFLKWLDTYKKRAV